ncbi:MAG: OsmC family protein [Myxococcota bacterium]|nr:OsmC family protein [Myxococcota bacterium]
MQVTVKRVENVSWMVSSESGHAIVIDGSPAIGGRNLGMRPMELILAGLGGCTAMDIVSTLRKQRQVVHDISITVDGTRADAIPSVFTDIALTYRVEGMNLSAKAVQRAVKLSAETYCSVSKMLTPSVNITYTIDLIERATDEADRSS